MREKVLGVFLDSALLVDDRAVGLLLQQTDPVSAALRIVRAVLAADDPPLVVGPTEVHQHLAEVPRSAGGAPIVIMPPPGQGAMTATRLPDDLPGGRAHARTVTAPAPVAAPVTAPVAAPAAAPAIVRDVSPLETPVVAPSVPRSVVVPRPQLPSAGVNDGNGGSLGRGGYGGYGGNGGNGSCMEVLTDITGNSTCSGCATDFARYFQDRFARLRRLIINRQEMSGAIPVAAVQHSTGPIKTLGMVVDRQSTAKGGVIFGLEDPSGTLKVLCSPDRVPLDIVTDEVVGVVGNLSKDRSILYADAIVRPDIPLRRSGHRSDRDLHVAFASDIHVGSNTFLDAHWDRFMDFLNGRLETSNGLLDTLEYLIVPGDLVDGIGVYPNQRDELLIPDIYRQYEALAELLKDVPDHIKMVLMPGNHDAVRQAEPQPALPKDIQQYFTGRVTFLGNPSLVSIEGVRVLAYHGRSFDDYVTAVQACTYEQPLVTMKEMLRRRHLAPVYGGRTPIAPEASDHLVVETIPDIFVTGHVHGAGVEAYRGSLLINASAWQAQTKYQKSMNFVPDPAKVPIVNLRDMSVKVMDFGS